LTDSIVGIAEDSDGSLWFSSRQGLTRLDPDAGQIVNHVPQSGLPTSEFNPRAAAADAAYLYFGSAAGLVSVPTGAEFRTRAAPLVHVTELERLTGNSSIRQPLGNGDRVRVPYDEALSVRFAVLDYAEVPHNYEYRLKTRDAWIPIGTRHELLLANLAPGNYELQVRGRDVFGQWGGSDALRIEVVPPFWMTDWFRMLLVSSLALLLLVAHRVRLGALKRRNEELEALKNQRETALHRAEASQRRLSEAYEDLRGLTQRLESAKEEERLAISRELHDDLGQSLTAAKLNLQLLRRQKGSATGLVRLDDTVGMLDSMIGRVRTISLALRPPLLDEAGLVPALELYLDAIAERSGIDIHLDAAGAVPDGDTPAMRLTVFRIVQEAVNNALRHAEARTIDVRMRRDEDGLRVEIQDDGIGFDLQAVQDRARGGRHLGLLGMAERVHGLAGRFSIDTRPGAGCRIEAWIPYSTGAVAEGDA
jgi:signal transduction histidine kinase